MACEAGLVGMAVYVEDGGGGGRREVAASWGFRGGFEAIGGGGGGEAEGGKLEAFIRGRMKGVEVVRGEGDLEGAGEVRCLEGTEAPLGEGKTQEEVRCLEGTGEQKVRMRIEELREVIRGQIRLLEESGTGHLRDARMMKIKGRVVFGYNAQVVVDGDWGLMGGADVGLWGGR